MKKFHFKFFFSCLLTSLLLTINAQNKSFFITPRISLQSDFQKADFKDARFPFEFKEHTATQLNYGIDLLIDKYLTDKLSVYIGAGYFRNKFNFKKFYDHQLLNIGTDSIPLGTATRNYIYNLIRFPLGVAYTIISTKKKTYKIGAEIIFNCSFQKIYNGGKPFPSANNKLSKFQYSGNTINLFATVAIPINSNLFFEIEPYVRLYDTFKKDKVFYENPSENITHNFDALGLSLKYSFS
ncbi:MAG: hypothetical protein M3Z92_02955 [Bacteroidota bacterium]|nr:hypothetical protein [Bacteroidota bacterium]